jgi:hypothetical protein
MRLNRRHEKGITFMQMRNTKIPSTRYNIAMFTRRMTMFRDRRILQQMEDRSATATRLAMQVTNENTGIRFNPAPLRFLKIVDMINPSTQCSRVATLCLNFEQQADLLTVQ